MALERRKFTQEFKLNAVRLVVEEGRVARQVADELGIPPKTLYNCWLSTARALSSMRTPGTAHPMKPKRPSFAPRSVVLSRSLPS